jgi:predicted metalloprotease with PDZ domain
LLIEPRGKPARFVVTQVVPDSKAAQTSLAPGDEVVTLDGAPPAQAPRLLLRRRPGQQIEIVFRRGGRTLAGMVGLDARR